jgi:hypothetical protein
MMVQTSRAMLRGPALTLALILGMGAASGCGNDSTATIPAAGLSTIFAR